MKKYFLIKNDTKNGPYSISELQNIDFNNDTLIWHNGLENWKKAEEFEELLVILEETPPPIPIAVSQSNKTINTESPIEVILYNNPKTTKEEKAEKLRSSVKSILNEIGYLILFFLSSLLVGFIIYQIFYNSNKPELVSKENQRHFSDEYYQRQEEQGNGILYFGDIYIKYLGVYKYDNETHWTSDFDDINTWRLRILTEKTKVIAEYTFYILFSFLVIIRYLSLFIKWLKPKSKENSLIDGEINSEISEP
jgi:hypothetical protein